MEDNHRSAPLDPDNGGDKYELYYDGSAGSKRTDNPALLEPIFE